MVNRLFDARQRKILRDIWFNRGRSLMVIGSILIGLSAIGTVFSTRQEVLQAVADRYQAGQPPQFTLLTNQTFDQTIVDELEALDEVSMIEARRTLSAQIEDGDDTIPIRVMALPNWNQQQVAIVSSESGAWPPSAREALVERDVIQLLNLDDSLELTISFLNGETQQVTIGGEAHDVFQIPAGLANTGYLYVTAETLEVWEIESPNDFNELNVIIEENRLDQRQIDYVLNVVQQELERKGFTVQATFMSFEPGVHPAQTIVNGILFILGALGIIILILSGFLVMNTMSAYLVAQRRDIGVMKSSGATHTQLLKMYLCIPLVFSMVALLAAIPIALIGYQALTDFTLGMLNFDRVNAGFPNSVWGLMLGLGLVIPFAAAFWPIWKASDMTVHDAIDSNSQGRAIRFGTSNGSMPRMVFLALRNTFQKPTRLLLTLAVLSLGSATFISVLTVSLSVEKTLTSIKSFWQFDTVIQLDRPVMRTQLANILDEVDEVDSYELWLTGFGRIVDSVGFKSSNMLVVGAPFDTEFIEPQLIEGRWLNSAETDEVVINIDVLRFNEVAVGDTIKLTLLNQVVEMNVVGVVKGQLAQPAIYIAQSKLHDVIGVDFLANRLVVRGSAVNLDDYLATQLRRNQIGMASVNTVDELTILANNQLMVVVMLLSLLAVMVIAVGVIGLVITLGTNIAERQRELAVMRATGATRMHLFYIVAIEATFIGLLSWLFGVMLSLSLSRMLSEGVGNAIIMTPLDYQYASMSLLSWLLITLIVSVGASFLVTRGLTTNSVAETLRFV